ncbi:SHOCT domain-containing protein [Microbacterium hominis]|uniref:SHOCT domain-containing protein n=1 Tax=Microbacterium hominis TaxID=162426 RepID=A0A7D4QGI8_9MICO|nr:SHOCT domain-containing protein [Microbacterium hominis]QKJ18316.1 SHOCT domain-containing protein [Microbacterium hominis]
MGLLRGVARTAVIAGTATAVSNRVSRRQANRWQTQADAQAYNEQQQAGYAQPAPPPPAPAAAAPSSDDMLAKLTQLGQLKAAGVLTEAEFEAQKAKILAGL